MNVHPFIAALRSDRAPQRKAQSAMEAAAASWKEDSGASQLTSELERYGNGAPIEHCPQLEKMFLEQGEAERLMECLSRHYCAAITANPIGHPPFRNGFNGSSGTILLGRSNRAQLQIQFREPGKYRQPTYKFSDGLRFDAVLAGKAEASIVRASSAHGGQRLKFDREALSLRGGERLAFDLASETFTTEVVSRRLVTLRLIRTHADPQPSREHLVETGELLLQSAAQISTSRQEAIIALLGRMGRVDAVPEMSRIALGGGDPSMRWQAIREALALDTGQGFQTLTAVSRDPEDPLGSSAGALRAQLLEAHPELADLEANQCPA